MVPYKTSVDMAVILDFGNDQGKWRTSVIDQIVPFYSVNFKCVGTQYRNINWFNTRHIRNRKKNMSIHRSCEVDGFF